MYFAPKRPAFLRAFCHSVYLMMAMVVSTAESKAASAEAYARTAITISAAIIRLGSVVKLRSMISSPRCVTIAPVVAVVTMPLVTTMRTEIRRLASHIAFDFGLNRIVRGVCCRSSKQHGCADRKHHS